MTTRANRLLTLAFRAHERGEPEIASRMATLAFNSPDSSSIIEALQSSASGKPESDVERAEAMLRKAEASTKGDVFTAEGKANLLTIAEKVHSAGFSKVAKSIAKIAQ